MMGALLAIFLPHSGDVLGFDVLFNSPQAKDLGIEFPERVYAHLLLIGGVLLTIGTIVSRSWIVGWVNWAFTGIGWWYSVLSVWMRQTKPGDHPGPSYGLILGVVSMTILFGALTWLLLSRTPLQKQLARARREEAHHNDELRSHQQILRTGIVPREHEEIVDDRRRRVKDRRRRVQD